jgi:hypothetical protein
MQPDRSAAERDGGDDDHLRSRPAPRLARAGAPVPLHLLGEHLERAGDQRDRTIRVVARPTTSYLGQENCYSAPVSATASVEGKGRHGVGQRP